MTNKMIRSSENPTIPAAAVNKNDIMLSIIAGTLSKAFLDISNNQLAQFLNDCFILSVIFFPALPLQAALPLIPTDLTIVSIINPYPKLIAAIVNPYFLKI